MVNIQWHDATSILLTKDDDSTLILRKGEFITYEGRELGAKIIHFSGNDPAGPIGMEYLPWRGDRWATPAISLRGNTRHIICYPVGILHFGQHINWNTVELLNHGVCPKRDISLSFSKLNMNLNEND